MQNKTFEKDAPVPSGETKVPGTAWTAIVIHATTRRALEIPPLAMDQVEPSGSGSSNSESDAAKNREVSNSRPWPPPSEISNVQTLLAECFFRRNRTQSSHLSVPPGSAFHALKAPNTVRRVIWWTDTGPRSSASRSFSPRVLISSSVPTPHRSDVNGSHEGGCSRSCDAAGESVASRRRDGWMVAVKVRRVAGFSRANLYETNPPDNLAQVTGLSTPGGP